MQEAIRVLLVDDHPVVRRGVRFFLETQGDIQIIGEAATGEEAVRIAGDEAPDVVLLDLIMPGIGGVEAARQIKTRSPHTAIVVLTSSEEKEHVFPAMKAGASAYTLKDVGPQELGAIIRRVAGGEVIIEPRIAAHLVTAMRSRDASSERLSELTARETEILRLLAEGLSNGEIAGRLFISDKTVKTHVSNLLSKLQLADRTQAAIFAWKAGLLTEQKV